MKILEQFGTAVFDNFRNKKTFFGFKDIQIGEFFPFNLDKYIERPLTNLEFNVIQDYVYGNILDIDCGSGIHLDYIRRKNNVGNVIGIEKNKKLVALGNLFNRGKVINTDFFDNTFSIKFDTITIFDNTIGIFDLNKLFKKIKEIINIDGQIIIFFRKDNIRDIKNKVMNKYKGVLNNKISSDIIEINLYNIKYFQRLVDKKYGFNSFLVGEDDNSYCLILTNK